MRRQLHTNANAALADPKIKARLADLGSVAMPMTTAEFGKFVADETEKNFMPPAHGIPYGQKIETVENVGT